MKKLMFVLMTLLASQAMAADPVKNTPVQNKVQAVKPAVPANVIANPCPEGWSLAPGSSTPSGAYTCVPKKPATVNKQCPDRHQWVEDACSFGCRQVIY